jgi:hypothetical protein
MQGTISIVVSRRPGLLAQIVSALVGEGCKLVRQAVSVDGDPARQRFTITVEGPEAALAALPRVLGAFGSVERQETASRPTVEAKPQEVERAVEEITAAFPDGAEVARRVRALGAALPAAVRGTTLAALGERLGRREYARNYALGSPLRLEAALRRMVLPAVRQLAKAEVDGLLLRLPACPFCEPSSAGDAGCDFLVGFARGLLHAAPATAGTTVREARCRAQGAPSCELHFAVT